MKPAGPDGVVCDQTDRLRRLERSERRSRWIVGVLLGMAPVALLLGARPVGPPAEVRAERLVIQKDGGKARIVLSIGKDDCPRIELFDKDGHSRLWAGTNARVGAALSVLDGDTGDAIILGNDKGGHVFQNFQSEVGVGIQIDLDRDGRGSLQSFDPEGKPEFVAPTRKP